jgi:hypothetical protein
VVYDEGRRKYARGDRPQRAVTPRINQSRLRGRAANNPVRNIISVAREYEKHLARSDIFGYRQVAEHFGVSKVMVSYYLALLNRLPQVFIAWLECCTENIPLAFFSLKRLRPVTRLDEDERKGMLLALAQTLVTEMEGEPSDAVPELLRLQGEQSISGPRSREHRSIQLD